MKPLAFPALVIAMLLAGGAAMAQSPNGLVGGSQFNPPLPPPPPPPSLAVPVVPKMDVTSPQNVPDVPQTSFHERITHCLDEAAAAGLGPADRAAYSRACANR
jgi:hypothetical protein